MCDFAIWFHALPCIHTTQTYFTLGHVANIYAPLTNGHVPHTICANLTYTHINPSHVRHVCISHTHAHTSYKHMWTPHINITYKHTTLFEHTNTLAHSLASLCFPGLWLNMFLERGQFFFFLILDIADLSLGIWGPDEQLWIIPSFNEIRPFLIFFFCCCFKCCDFLA